MILYALLSSYFILTSPSNYIDVVSTSMLLPPYIHFHIIACDNSDKISESHVINHSQCVITPRWYPTYSVIAKVVVTQHCSSPHFCLEIFKYDSGKKVTCVFTCTFFNTFSLHTFSSILLSHTFSPYFLSLLSLLCIFCFLFFSCGVVYFSFAFFNSAHTKIMQAYLMLHNLAKFGLPFVIPFNATLVHRT